MVCNPAGMGGIHLELAGNIDLAWFKVKYSG
jgi:hypothetical protein